MKCTGRNLFLGCLLLATPLLASAGDNSLLVPTESRCALNVPDEDLANALTACEEAAKLGDAQAQYELGEFYYNGQRTQPDLPKARYWFEQSSLQGNADAQLRLGNMFLHGESVPPNKVQAYIVLKMAAVNGSDEAMDNADQVAEQMPREELQVASQVLGQIFRSYLLELQNIDSEPSSGFSPAPHSPSGSLSPQAPAFAP
ncbi:tetratricopeptide repeat protein [Pseudomonas sp. GOM6]|uniref:tetratricopeptide repeat protein n=1 Tax=Pseudomonas sp. GOM6 TaxID=3036944 RepID=UPI002409CFD1|nr:tetratricopeptide repeat protein [Pseudomonas sp. GOM6]MDG1580630.1 tetratricopeptide repeat protein [Pseudomonas sp. GOM6]